MIVKLCGIWQDGYVDVKGVGYSVETTQELEIGVKVDLYIRSVWRENSGWSFYGFATEAERRCFDSMCKVHRVGPSAACAILRTNGLETTIAAIAAKNPELLSKTPGVGKKTAEQICTQASLDEDLLHLSKEVVFEPKDDVVEALVSLGYDEKRANEAVKEARKNSQDEEDVLREALRIAGGSI